MCTSDGSRQGSDNKPESPSSEMDSAWWGLFSRPLYECIALLAFSASLCNRSSSVIWYLTDGYWQSILGKCAVLTAYGYQNIINHCDCML